MEDRGSMIRFRTIRSFELSKIEHLKFYDALKKISRFTNPKALAKRRRCSLEFGEKGRLYAGGTELLLAMKHDLLRYEHLVDVKTIPDLNKIELKNGALMIGSTATHRAIERSALVKQNLPVFAEMETNVANIRVRACGTLGGNLCFAEPHSDPATLLTRSRRQEPMSRAKPARRTVAIDKLITGAYETSLAERRTAGRCRDSSAGKNPARRVSQIPTQGTAHFGLGAASSILTATTSRKLPPWSAASARRRLSPTRPTALLTGAQSASRKATPRRRRSFGSSRRSGGRSRRRRRLQAPLDRRIFETGICPSAVLISHHACDRIWIFLTKAISLASAPSPASGFSFM